MTAVVTLFSESIVRNEHDVYKSLSFDQCFIKPDNKYFQICKNLTCKI